MTGGKDLRDQIRNVAYQPRDPFTFHTAFGPATISVGAGFDQVVVTLTPAAADELARVVAASKRLDPVDGAEPDSDPATWYGVVVDLLASSALCSPGAYPNAQHARIEGVAT